MLASWPNFFDSERIGGKPQTWKVYSRLFLFYLPTVCEQALDIGVIIDASESVKLPNYKLCLQFVANLTEHFKVSQKGTHFGSIVYSSDAELQFSFKDIQYHDAESLKKKIKSFPYLREGTRTDIALELANTLLFSVQGGDRFDKPDVLIVITDGLTDPERSKPYPVVLKPLEVSIGTF